MDGRAEGLAALRLHGVRTRLTAAAAAAARDPKGIILVAVSKTQTAEAVATLARLGQRDFGENYLQEALPKIEALGDLDLIWHFIGQLQSNKIRTFLPIQYPHPLINLNPRLQSIFPNRLI